MWSNYIFVVVVVDVECSYVYRCAAMENRIDIVHYIPKGRNGKRRQKAKNERKAWLTIRKDINRNYSIGKLTHYDMCSFNAKCSI